MHKRFIEKLFAKHKLSDSLSYSIDEQNILKIISRYEYQAVEIDINLITATEINFNTISLITRYGKYSFIKKEQLTTYERQEKRIEKIRKKIFKKMFGG